MDYELYSYRYAVKILQHAAFKAAWKEIDAVIRGTPLFVYPGKSGKNKQLDVVQQLMNTYYDRVLAVDRKWKYHPRATGIAGSQLTADFRKQFVGTDGSTLTVQAEIQLGNMSRWYTDIFKFQAAYSERMVQVGLSVVPVADLARRIDSNVVQFERASRELPSAELSITLPIVLVGLKPDRKTVVADLSKSKFAGIKDFTGKQSKASNPGQNRLRVVHAFLSGTSIDKVGPQSDVGPPLPAVEADMVEEDVEEEQT